jgi:hypothetical protein
MDKTIHSTNLKYSLQIRIQPTSKQTIIFFNGWTILSVCEHHRQHGAEAATAAVVAPAPTKTAAVAAPLVKQLFNGAETILKNIW